MPGVLGGNAEAAGVVGGCIVFPPHFEQTPGEVLVLPVLVSEFVF